MTRPTPDDLSSFFQSIESPADRYAYVMERIRHCGGISNHAINRAFSLAAELLGVRYSTARHLAQYDFVGVEPPLDRIGELSPGSVGYVYLARRSEQPGLVKVGFSTNPARRERELSTGGPGLRIFKTYVGTMLDEHVVHCDRRALRVEGEWFRAKRQSPDLRVVS